MRFAPSAALLMAAPVVAQYPEAPSQRLPVAQANAPGAPLGDSGIGYADLADLVIAAPVIVDATIRSTAKIKPAEAPGLRPGLTRYYVEADVGTLVRGADGIPAQVGYLIDVAPDSSGRLPKFKKRRVLVFGRHAPTGAGQLQLVAPDAQRDWTPELDAEVRRIARASLAQDAPPRITGIGNAFHVPGALPGEGETQVFLTTANGAPVSLSVLRRPGERPRWAVALSDIVDEAAAPPPPRSLLWYRLACGLPAALPATSTTALAPDDAAKAQADYAFVLAQLGPCGRTRAEPIS
ncbi:hypothetical protein EAH84_04120 [Sphingomonas oligophenolica]|uniref:Uncharacterized protein n=1 Tax=Sphingomonas oligophenolica TaxID=301154 RepID=A0A502CS41_9SPHN|nr:hypothetical protein EAH84_04120 [Sphingomonas oligophenolica]